jgi:hypothetical protein
MSQQINLILPELRRRFDWLGLPVVAGVAVAGLLAVLAAAQVQSLRIGRLQAEDAALNGQLLALQQQVQGLGQALGSRKPDATLPPQIELARMAIGQREEVLGYIERGDTRKKGGGFAGMLQGFARQTVDGVWLVGFGLATDGIEIRGRLVDPALLPVYINRLNGDQAFAGRRFSALEMQGVTPVIEATPPAADKNPAPVSKVAGRPYTEFALRTEAAPSLEKKP